MLDKKLKPKQVAVETPHDVLLTPIPEQEVQGRSVKRRKRVKFTDLHTQQNFYIENVVVDILDEIIADAWGEKSRMANEAFKMFIREKYPQYAHRIKT